MNCPICRESFTEEDKRTLFLSSKIECKVCWVIKDSFEFDCLKCGHAFCKTCIYQLNTDTRNSEMSPELWINIYEPTLQFVSQHYMDEKNWPPNVIQYIQLYWYSYPVLHPWPRNSTIYYRFSNDNRNPLTSL
jgi:hypothetical protein